MSAQVATELPKSLCPGRGHVVVVSPSVHLRMDVRSTLRGKGVEAHLLKTMRQLRSLRASVGRRGVIVDAQLVPRPSRRDHWTRSLLKEPGTHLVHSVEEAMSVAESVAAAER